MSRYPPVSEETRAHYEQLSLQDATGVVAASALVQIADELDINPDDVSFEQYNDWFKPKDHRVGWGGRDKFEYAKEELTRSEHEEVLAAFHYFVNRRGGRNSQLLRGD